jgi:hypothetical protein
MRKIVTIGLGFTALAVAAIGSPAMAASHGCGTPPPSWWFAPRVSYTYSGSSYASSGSSHTFSAQRHSAVRYERTSSHSYRDPNARW